MLPSVCAGFLVTWGTDKKAKILCWKRSNLFYVQRVYGTELPLVSLLCVQTLAAVKPLKDGKRCSALIYCPPFAWQRDEDLKQAIALLRTPLHGSGAVTREQTTPVYTERRVACTEQVKEPGGIMP